jgi:hypothetical protein
MKVSLCLSLMLSLCAVTLHAQDVAADSVATEEEYQYLENSDDADDANDTDSDDETPSVTHELVPPAQLPTTQNHAREKMNVRKFDHQQWKEVVGSETFQEEPDKPRKKKEDDDDSSSYNFSEHLPWNGDFLRVVAYVVIIALILGVVYFFTKDLRFKVKVSASAPPVDDLTAAVENIEHIEVAPPLQKALADGNFKLATRLYFLDLLKRLNETGLIAWKKDKTNHDYLMELYAKEFHFHDIRRLTLAYELVWYGEHALSNEAYQKLFADFESVFLKINTPAAA